VPPSARAVNTSHPNRVVGRGTPASCTSAVVVRAVTKGGIITFNCGPKPVTITMKATAKVVNTSQRVVLDGGGLVTLSGGGKREILIQLAPPIATVCAAALGLTRGQGKLRRNLRSAAEIANLLPMESASWNALMKYIEWEIGLLQQRERSGGRDRFGFGLGLAFILGFGYPTILLFSYNHWWRWFGLATLLLAVFGFAGVADGLSIQNRDDRRSRRRKKLMEKSRRKAHLSMPKARLSLARPPNGAGSCRGRSQSGERPRARPCGMA
jgi:hypothetical protein